MRLRQAERGLQSGSGAASTSDMVTIIHEVPRRDPLRRVLGAPGSPRHISSLFPDFRDVGWSPVFSKACLVQKAWRLHVTAKLLSSAVCCMSHSGRSTSCHVHAHELRALRVGAKGGALLASDLIIGVLALLKHYENLFRLPKKLTMSWHACT